jgi:hypothetical protein
VDGEGEIGKRQRTGAVQDAGATPSPVCEHPQGFGLRESAAPLAVYVGRRFQSRRAAGKVGPFDPPGWSGKLASVIGASTAYLSIGPLPFLYFSASSPAPARNLFPQ